MTNYYENIHTGVIVEMVDSSLIELIYQNYYRKSNEPWQKMLKPQFLELHIPIEAPKVRQLDHHYTTIKLKG